MNLKQELFCIFVDIVFVKKLLKLNIILGLKSLCVSLDCRLLDLLYSFVSNTASNFDMLTKNLNVS